MQAGGLGVLLGEVAEEHGGIASGKQAGGNLFGLVRDRDGG